MSNNLQKDYFLQEGADAWYERNKHAMSNRSIGDEALLEALRQLSFTPQKVLDIGCATGEKLKIVQDTYKCECYGIEPSQKAVLEGSTRKDCNLHLCVGTADNLPYDDTCFDIVIFSGVLVWCARNTLFKIAQEVDRVLKIGGAIIIADFESRVLLRNTLKHADSDIWSYKMEHEKMFTWHPQYVVSSKISYDLKSLGFTSTPNERRAITTIMKVYEKDSMATNPWE